MKYTTHPYELIVVDNGSSDGTGRYLKGLKSRLITGDKRKIRAFKPVISEKNLGVSGALNIGIGIAKGKYVCYLNNDVIVTVNWLEGLVGCAQSDKKIGMVGCSTNKIRNARGLFPRLAGFRNIKEIQKMAIGASLLRERQYKKAHFIHGFCMLIKRGVVDKVGLFDERFYPCNGEDLDYSFRARKAGFKLVNAMNVFVFHFTSKATKSNKFIEQYGPIENIPSMTKIKFIKKFGDEGRRYLKIYLDNQSIQKEQKS